MVTAGLYFAILTEETKNLKYKNLSNFPEQQQQK